MFQQYKFSVDNSTYNDNIQVHPAHFNSMRAKPVLPQAIIENNLKGLRSYPNTWIRTKDEWKYFRDDKKFRKRCLFNVDNEERIHLASLDTISNQHLLPAIKFPYEDDVFRTLGQKRNIIDKRNGFKEFSPGDKTYRSVEYSNEYFSRQNRNWREEKFALTRRNEETFPDLAGLLNLSERQVSAIFSNQVDYDYEKDLPNEKQEELESVTNLDTWRPNTPMQPAFKVLDLGEKALKYRPRVNR